MNRRRWFGAAMALIAAAGLGWFFYPRDLPADSADGVYLHDCCGEVVLRNGRMILNEKKYVDYVVGRDESGPYVLPNTFVGTWEHIGLEADGGREPAKLRVDRIPKPTRIDLPAPGGLYRFERKVARKPLLERQQRQALKPEA